MFSNPIIIFSNIELTSYHKTNNRNMSLIYTNKQFKQNKIISKIIQTLSLKKYKSIHETFKFKIWSSNKKEIRSSNITVVFAFLPTFLESKIFLKRASQPRIPRLMKRPGSSALGDLARYELHIVPSLRQSFSKDLKIQVWKAASLSFQVLVGPFGFLGRRWEKVSKGPYQMKWKELVEDYLERKRNKVFFIFFFQFFAGGN